MTSRIGACLLVAFTLFMAWGFAVGQSPKPAAAPAAIQSWELIKVDRGTEGWKKAQAMAGEGWELVAVDVSAFYLKRPK